MNRTAEDLLQELLSLGASRRIEAPGHARIDRAALRTLCAFANEPGQGGGYLLWGLEPVPPDSAAPSAPGTGAAPTAPAVPSTWTAPATLADQATAPASAVPQAQPAPDAPTTTEPPPRYRVVGVAQPEQLQAELARHCASAFNTALRPQVRTERLARHTVVVAYLPEAAPATKPVFLAHQGLPRGAYRRIGSSDQPGTEDDLAALYAARHATTLDAAVLPDAQWHDIDPAALEEYRQLRRQAHPGAEELIWNDHDLLRALGCAQGEGEQLRPTVAGIVLFGTPLALRRCLPMARIDYIRVPGRVWAPDPEAPYETQEIRAPLLAAIRRASNAVRYELTAPAPGTDGPAAHDDSLPQRAVREAIVNAVLHRSYRLQAPVQIIRYDNRLEIRNPGHALKPSAQWDAPGALLRNPRIAAVLHDVRLASTKGSGIRTLREQMLAHDLLPPTLASQRSADQFVATLLFHQFLGPDDRAWLRRLTREALSDEEARALVLVRECGQIDAATYSAINRSDATTASAHLQRLEQLGLLQAHGQGERAHWLLGALAQERLAELAAPVVAALPVEPILEQAPPPENGLEPILEGHQSSEYGHHIGLDGLQPIENGHQMLGSIPESILARIPAPGTKPRREALHDLLRDLCAWRALSSREIALVLGKQDHKKLVRNYLSPMVASGVLAYTLPEQENHPDQRYTVPAPAHMP